MPTYTRADRLAEIQKAGFQNPLTALAVSLAEFPENRDVNAQSQSDYVSGGVREPSFGPWQLHLPTWGHPSNLFPSGITQSCAMDLHCSTQAAAKISRGGTDFSDWSAFTNGSYKPYLSEVTAPFQNITKDISIPFIAPGDTGPAGPSGGAAGGAPSDCRVLNPLELIQIGDPTSHFSKMSGADIAAELGISPECLKYRIGGFIGAIDTVPGVKGGAEAKDALGKALTENPLAGALGTLSNAFRSENLWRAAFIVVGAGAVFLGGRMYLSNPDGVREAA